VFQRSFIELRSDGKAKQLLLTYCGLTAMQGAAAQFHLPIVGSKA
jgi:hypothetical protein